jgi:transposase
MAAEFWLSDEQWGAIEPLLPRNQPGPEREDDRRIISGIVHVLKVGCRWQDCPAVYGPSTTITIAFDDGPCAASGGDCSRLWPTRRPERLSF